MAWGQLNGERVISGTVTIPSWGAWVADLVLALPDAIPSPSVLELGTLSLLGTPYRTSPFAGSRGVRLVGGYGGWFQTVPSQAYNHPGGLLLSLLLGDVSALVGERVVLAQDRLVGSTYVREAGPAERTLRQFTDPYVGPLWWVRPDGTTFVGPHPASVVRSPFTLIGFSGGKGRFTIATESEADWLPGASFATATDPTPQTVNAVHYSIDPDGPVRLDVLA